MYFKRLMIKNSGHNLASSYSKIKGQTSVCKYSCSFKYLVPLCSILILKHTKIIYKQSKQQQKLKGNECLWCLTVVPWMQQNFDAEAKRW